MGDSVRDVIPDLSRVTLPTGSVYNLKDQAARDLISELEKKGKYLGKTTTDISDGSTSNPISVEKDGVVEQVTAIEGDWAIYDKYDGLTKLGTIESIWNGTTWQEFGDLSDMGSLAYKDSASGTYTPAGSVSTPSFTGTQATIQVSGTPSGTVSTPTFTGDEATVNVSGTAQAQVFTGSPVDYTPAGTNSGGNVTLTYETINSIESVGTLPSATMPTFTVENETLIITAGSFNAGTLPVKGADTVVASGIDTITQPTFTGTLAQITAEGSNATSNVSASGTTTPSGSISTPTFTGDALTSEGTYTPEGTNSQPAFTGSEATITVS